MTHIASLPILHAEDVAEILTNACRVHTRPVCLRDEYFKRKNVQVTRLQPLLVSRKAKAPTLSTVHDLSTRIPPTVFVDDQRFALHVDEGQCYCPECVERRNKPTLTPTDQDFCEQMLACGFNDSDGVVPTSSLADDVLFLWSRINSLAVKDFQTVSKSIREASPIPNRPLEHLRSKNIVARPLEGTAITETPAHWSPTYWRKTVGRLPNGAQFHDQLLNEIEKVELNHDLPSGKTRTYAFGTKQASTSALTLHWVDSRFEAKPYLIDDASATFEEQTPSAVREEWLSPEIQIEYKRGKNVITNIRCKICGAVNKQKYPQSSLLGSNKTKVCKVDSDYLCNRKACIEARDIKGVFDAQRLRTGYRLHKLFASPIHISLISWVRSNEHGEADPNLKCDLRYDFDRRGRKGVKKQIKDLTDNTDAKDPISAVAVPSTVRTADKIFATRYAEEGFHATFENITPMASQITSWEFDERFHKVVGDLFEERRHIPNFYCFGPRRIPPVDKSQPKKIREPKRQVLNFGSCELPYCWVVLDSSVNELDELNIWKQVKSEFAKDGLKWYDPNNLHSHIITTWKNTRGAADVIRQRQLSRIEKLRAAGRGSEFIEDVYLKGKSMKQIAKEQKTTAAAVKQKIYRDLSKPILSEDQQWLRASGDCKQNGIYAVAALHGKPRAYLLLSADEFKPLYDENVASIEDGLHNTICDILVRRVKNGRIKNDGELEPMYREIYDEFQRLGWRMLRDGQWYDEYQQPIVPSTV